MDRRRRTLLGFPPGVGPGAGGVTYDAEILALGPTSYLPLDESTGSTARDLSPNGLNATYGAGIQLANANFLDSRPLIRVNGSFVNCYSAAFAAAFTPAAFTYLAWYKLDPDTPWGSGAANKFLFNLFADANNRCYMLASHSGAHVLRYNYTAGGVAKQLELSDMETTGYFQVGISVDKAADVCVFYLNAEPVATFSSLGTWSGSLYYTTTVIGASDTLGTQPFPGWTGRRALFPYALSSDQIQTAFRVLRPIRQILFCGDSKTNGDSWPVGLRQLLGDHEGVAYHSMSSAYAAGGWRVAELKDYVVANLAAETGNPGIILINLGSNDVAALPAEATWKANYRYIIEAFHAKWPFALIYLAKPVRLTEAVPPGTPVADSGTMWGWIDDLVAEYAYVYAGIDETALEGGDGYATNLVDMTHYRVPAGELAVAALWLDVLT